MREAYHIERTLTKNEWVEILIDNSLTKEVNIALLQAMYSFEGHKAAASQIGLILGYTGKYPASPLNLEIGRYGKRVAEKYPVWFSKRLDGSERKWDIFFNGWQEGRLFIWQIKKELAEALGETGLTGEEYLSEELSPEISRQLIEGAKRTITVNSYERNKKARELCVKHYGTICQVCEFDFEQTYGAIGKGFIHIHHVVSMADIGEEYEVNPIIDLRPVCPNCHAMLHKTEPPLTIEELKEILKK